MILLDSSGLIHAFSRKIDIVTWFNFLFGYSYNICLTKPILEELKKLSTMNTGKIRLLASLSLQLCEKYMVLDTEAKVGDDSLVEAALTYGGVVFTCDSGLRRRLAKHGVPTLIITHDNRLIFGS
ncbi:MAG: hypothetical protein QW429_05845 [Thermoprotei archaeon]